MLHPTILKTKPADDIEETTEGIEMSGGTSVSLQVNLQSGSAASLTDKLPSEQLLQEGRRESINKRHQDAVEQCEAAESLKKYARLTSGKLASQGQYHIDETTRDEVKKDVDAQARKAQEAEAKRNDRLKVLQERAEVAKGKLERNENLASEDLKALIQTLKEDGDSPMKTKIADLKAQLDRRLEGRKEKLFPDAT